MGNVKIFGNKCYSHRKEYNAGVERIGTQFKSAKNETEQRWALQRFIIHLENSKDLFCQDMDEFAKLIPPPKFQEFYLLMNSVLRDYYSAMTSFLTCYSSNLNQRTQDRELLNQASNLLRVANENLQRAGLMLDELTKSR